MPRRAPRNPSNDDLTQEQLEERQLVAEEKAQLVRLVDECIDRAVVLSNEHAYGACWRAVMLHLLKTRFTSLESVRSAGRHFGRVLERAQEYSPTRADKQALRGLYPVDLLENPYTIASLYDRFHNRHHGEPTHTPVQIPGHMTPEDVIETIEAYARSCLGRLSSPSAWEAAVGEWARYTRYSASHHEPDLGPKQRAMYVHALFSVLDNLYKEEDQAHAATRHFSSPGVDFLFARGLPLQVIQEADLPPAPETSEASFDWSPNFLHVQHQAVVAYNQRHPHDQVSSIEERREACEPRGRTDPRRTEKQGDMV